MIKDRSFCSRKCGCVSREGRNNVVKAIPSKHLLLLVRASFGSSQHLAHRNTEIFSDPVSFRRGNAKLAKKDEATIIKITN